MTACFTRAQMDKLIQMLNEITEKLGEVEDQANLMGVWNYIDGDVYKAKGILGHSTENLLKIRHGRID